VEAAAAAAAMLMPCPSYSTGDYWPISLNYDQLLL
jgi:hypothetical protein